MRKALNSYHIIMFFYFLSLINLISRLRQYAFNDFQLVATKDNYMYGWIPNDIDVNAYLSFINPVIMILLVFLFPLIRYQSVRILWALICYCVEGFQFAYILGHSSHAFVWCSFFFALIPGDLTYRAQAKKCDLDGYLRAGQLQIFLIYGLAGFWKAIGFTQSLFDPKIAGGFDYLQYAMSSEFVHSNTMGAAANWVADQPIMGFFLSGLVLFAQTGSLVAAFIPRTYFFWGLTLASFHIGTLITTNIIFYWSIPPILLLLTLRPMSDESVLAPLKRI